MPPADDSPALRVACRSAIHSQSPRLALRAKRPPGRCSCGRATPRCASGGRFVAACYAAEFVDEFAPEGQGIAGLYEQLVEVLERLDGPTPVPDALFSFEARGLGALGYLPRVRECGVCRKEITRPDALFSSRDGGAACPDCRTRDDRWFPVRRASLESIARFAAGDMPREPMRTPLVVEIRQILDSCVHAHLERELKGARFLRDTLPQGA